MTGDQKIVGLYGNTQFDVEPAADVVIATLKDLLQRAESGEVIGLFVVTLDRGLGTTGYMVGKSSAAVIGRVYSMLSKAAVDYENDDDLDPHPHPA